MNEKELGRKLIEILGDKNEAFDVYCLLRDLGVFEFLREQERKEIENEREIYTK